ncbi:8-oxo-dGDP phosphatase [Aureococcus anophagefferens]|nr:8-oxo-dGDP phosphatase [Aureococcus anophagefferens]
MNVRSAALCCAFSCGRALELSSRLLARVRRVDAGGEAYAAARHFVVGGEVLGRVLPQAAEALGGTGLFDVSDEAVALPEEPGAADVVAARTARLAAAFGALREAGAVPMLAGWRDEPFAIRPSFHAAPRAVVERAAAPLLGASAPARCRAAMEAECAEEAGLSAALLAELRPAGAVSYTGLSQDGWGAKPDTLYVFDLPLPDDWTPTAVDGEVESFERIAVADLLDRLARDDDAWKPNVGTVLVDFVLRHGFVDPDEADYLELVVALRAGSCR